MYIRYPNPKNLLFDQKKVAKSRGLKVIDFDVSCSVEKSQKRTFFSKAPFRCSGTIQNPTFWTSKTLLFDQKTNFSIKNQLFGIQSQNFREARRQIQKWQLFNLNITKCFVLLRKKTFNFLYILCIFFYFGFFFVRTTECVGSRLTDIIIFRIYKLLRNYPRQSQSHDAACSFNLSRFIDKYKT